MKRVISRECYRLCHSKRMWFLLLLMLLMSILIFSISIGKKKEMVYVLLDETEEEREYFSRNGEIAQDIYDLLGHGHSDHNIGEPSCFYISPKAMELFQEGGALWEKYHSYQFPERMVLQQTLGGDIAPPEQEDFETNWRFHNMLEDPSAAGYVTMIFTALFFGMDFSMRTCQGALFAGKKRMSLFFGKYLFFFLLFAVLSLAELAVAIAVFIPKIWLVPTSELIKALLLRCLRDTGRALFCVPIACLGRSEWKAFGLTFVFMLLFMSNRAVLNLDPYQFAPEVYWETCSDIGTTIKIVLMTVAVFFGAGFLSAGLFQRAELK